MIPELYKRKEIKSASGAALGDISIGGTAPAVNDDCEIRNVLMLRAANAVRLPKAGEKQLFISCPDGSTVVLGTVEGTVPANLMPGEIYIETASASLLMKNSGSIEIHGDVSITGTLEINGSEISGT